MKKIPFKSITSDDLRWLRGSDAYPIQLLILKGYEAINYAAAYGSCATTGYGSKNFDFDLYQRLIPAPVTDWDSNVSRNRSAPPHYTEQISGWYPGTGSVVNDSVLPKVLMTRREIIQWLQAEMAGLKLNASRHFNLFRDASQLVQLGYRLARIAGRSLPMNSTPFAAALCMVGLGDVFYFPREITCHNCYRIASPWTERCNQHSQAKHVYLDNGSRSKNSQAARTGRQVMSKVEWTQNISQNMLPNSYAKEWRTAGMLWPLWGKQHDAWNLLVADSLNNAPLITQLLPPDFLTLSNKMQLERLRSALDENEWKIDRWPLKILAAQKWLAMERIVAPGRNIRGFSDINSERLKKARALRDLGLKPTEIAKQLDISPSHLSQLWRRQKIRDGTDS